MEKSIYVHILGFPEGHAKNSFKGSVNAWYVIKPGEGGVVEMTPAFEGVNQPKNPFDSALMYATCQVVGSRIYMLGGTTMASLHHSNPETSRFIQFIDTSRPNDGWQRCCTLSFYHCNGISFNVDDEWLVVFRGYLISHDKFLPPSPPVFCLNVHSGEVKRFPPHADLNGYPVFATCSSPGTVDAYMNESGSASLLKLDCSSYTWTVVCEGKWPYPVAQLADCYNVVDNGILYSYDSDSSKFRSYDLCQNVELYVVDLPNSTWFPRDLPFNLLVLANNSFCIVWHLSDCYRQMFIMYARFSVSGDVPKIVLEDTKTFPIARGYTILNVVAVSVDPNSGESRSSIDTITTDDDLREGAVTTDDDREGTMTTDDSREGTMSTDDNPRVKTLICQWNQILV